MVRRHKPAGNCKERGELAGEGLLLKVRLDFSFPEHMVLIIIKYPVPAKIYFYNT